MNSEYLRKSILVSLFSLVVLAPLVFYPWVTTFPMTKRTVVELTALLIAVLWVIWYAIKGRISVKSPLSKPLLALVGIILLSLINTSSLYRNLFGIGLWGTYILIYFVVISVIDDIRTINLLLGTAVFAGFLSAVYLIFQFYGIDFPFWARLGGRQRLFSTFGNPNYVAGYLIGCIPLIFAWFVKFKNRTRKILSGFLVSVLYTAVVMTYTRASWGALLLSAVFIFILLYIAFRKNIFKKEMNWLFGLGVVLLIILILYSTPNPVNYRGRSAIHRATSTIREAHPLGKRSLIWASTVQVAREHPIFGAGIGTLGVNYPEAQAEVLSKDNNSHLIPMTNKSINAHNDFLHMFAEIGIVGILVLIWILITFYFTGINFIRKTLRGDREGIPLIGILGGSFALLGHTIFSFPFHVIPNGLLFFVLMAASWVFQREYMDIHEDGIDSVKKESVNETANPFFRWGAVVVTVLVVILGIGRVNVFRADMKLKKAQILLKEDRYDVALEKAKEAKLINPYEGKIDRILGMAYLGEKKFSSAIDSLKQAEDNFLYQNLYNQLGYAYEKVNELAKAENAYKKSIRYFPNYSNAYHNLAQLYIGQGDSNYDSGSIKKAEEKYDQALRYFLQYKIFEPDFDLPESLAQNYYNLGLEFADKRNYSSEVGRSPLRYVNDKKLFLLPPKTQPAEPILLKYFLFTEEIKGEMEGKLSIFKGEKVRNKLKYEKEFSGKGNLVTFYLPGGLSTGRYLLEMELAPDGGQKFTISNQLDIIASENRFFNFDKFSISDFQPGEKGKIVISLRNKWSSSIPIDGILDVYNESGQKVLKLQLPEVNIPSGEKRSIKYEFLAENLNPGTYEGKLVLNYKGRTARTKTNFVVKKK